MVVLGTQAVAGSLVPVVAAQGSQQALGTGFLVQGRSRIFLIASEHVSVQGKQYACVVPDADLRATAATDPAQWLALRVEAFMPERHQAVLSFEHPSGLTVALAKRVPLQQTDMIPASSALMGEDVAFMGFWSKHPDIPATLRRAHVAAEGQGDILLNSKIVHGNSGAPVWRISDGKVIGTAQKSLVDSITLSTPVAGAVELETYADLVVITSLDMASNWIACQP